MSERWWRAYDGAIDDPKLQRLPPEIFRAWFNLCCLASQNDGRLPPLEDLAFRLRKTEAQVSKILETLLQRRLLDEVDGHLEPHNWRSRQFKSDVSTKRVQQFRERNRNVSLPPGNVSLGVPETATETPPETDTEAETEKRKDSSGRDATPTVRFAYPIDFEAFWESYPRTPVMSKKEAFAAWKRLSGDDRAAAAAAVPSYREFLRSKPDHPTVHACRFLSQRRFDGFSPQSENSQAPSSRVYLMRDDPRFEAWDRHRMATEGKGYPTDAKGGWWFDSEWPPGCEPPAQAERIA